MSSDLGHDQHAIQPGVRVLSGTTFDGVDYQIALEDAQIGLGASASILKGRVVGEPYVVALKVVHQLLEPAKQALLVKLLVRELHFAREVSLCHHYILGFLGTATLGNQTAIVSLYMRNGNLIEYAKNNPECDKKKLILQVAEAVEFLHLEKQLVHGDLKCENVLVSDYGDALLADFGLGSFVERSEHLSTTMTAIRQMNTFQFAAPELLGIPAADYGSDSDDMSDSDDTSDSFYGTPVSRKTTESDVYAFGMLIIQAITEKLPWGKKNQPAVIMSLSAGQHPRRPFTMSDPWWNICQKCWRFIPVMRPQIEEVLHTLKATDTAPSRILPFQEDMEAAVYTPDGTNIIALSHKHEILLLEIATGHVRHLANPGEDHMTELRGHLAVSPDGRNIACCIDKTLLVLDAASGVRVTAVEHEDYPSCVAYSRDGTRIATGSSKGLVRLWDAATGAALGWGLPDSGWGTTAVSFSPDGSCLASSSLCGSICLWDSMTCAPMRAAKPGLHACTNSFDFSPVAMQVVGGDGIDTVAVWDVREKRATHSFHTGCGATVCVAFSPSGRYAASGSEGGEIGIWDVQDDTQVGGMVAAPSGRVISLQFSPDGKSLLSVGEDDKKVRVWEIFFA